MNRFIRRITIITIFIVITISTINLSSAATAEVTSGKLPSQLHEGDKVSFTIQLKPDSSAEKNITIETNLLSSNNSPIYDFGDLNPAITENRYNQKITLDVSTLPSIVQVKISGEVPSGEIRTKPDNTDLVISKFINTELKFYEIHADQKLVGIESFELVINKKEKFEDTLQAIRRPEFDTLKNDARNLFDMGLPDEAQGLANDISTVKFPDSLTLIGIVKINNDMTLNAIFIIVIVVMFIISYSLGARQNDDEND